MPADWLRPSYATATLTVGLAKGEIGHFTIPPGAEVGDPIGTPTEPLGIGVRNVGGLAGTISLRIRDLGGATIWTGSITLAVDEYNYVYPAPSYPMPARDVTLRVEAYHDGVVDSYMDKTIVLIVVVDTETTLTLEPSSVEPGGAYRYKGRLTRVDTGAGLGGMEIIARREGVEVNRGTTDATGYYDIFSTAPTTIRTYNCVAAFPGVTPFAASSAQASLGVGMAVIEPIWAVVSAILGAAVVMVSTGK